MKFKIVFKITIWIMLVFTLTACELFQKANEAKVVARVHNVSLYEEDIKYFNIPSGLSEKDSVAVLVDHINNWATKQLILHEAKKNMTEKKQQEYNSLVEEYKLDLFSSAYENAYVAKNLKSGIKADEIEVYYNKYKENFLLQEDLVKVLYVKLSEKYKDLPAIRKAIKKADADAIEELKRIELSFLESDFNTKDVWTSYAMLVEKIPSLQNHRKDKILKNDYFLSYKLKGNRFYIKFKKVLKKGQPAPIAHVEDQIKQILLNKRKIKLKKQLEEEIRKDALQTKEYQIFE